MAIITDNFPQNITLPNHRIDDANIYLEQLKLHDDGTYSVDEVSKIIKYGDEKFNEIMSVEYKQEDDATYSLIFKIKPGETSYRTHYLTEIYRQRPMEDRFNNE